MTEDQQWEVIFIRVYDCQSQSIQFLRWAFKKIGTNCSSVLLLRFVPIFLRQTLSHNMHIWDAEICNLKKLQSYENKTYTARPCDMRPLGAYILQIEGFELAPKTLEIRRFTEIFVDFCCFSLISAKIPGILKTQGILQGLGTKFLWITTLSCTKCEVHVFFLGTSNCITWGLTVYQNVSTQNQYINYNKLMNCQPV